MAGIPDKLLENANLSYVVLISVNLQKTRLKKSDLSNSVLTGANLEGTDFSEAQLIACDFSNYDDTEGGKTRILHTIFRKADLTKAQFRGIDFSGGVDFTGAVLDGSDFKGANISIAEIDQASSKEGMILP